MATALDIITDALFENGAIAPGEEPSPDLAALGLRRFQNQLDAWAADFLTLAVQDRQTHTVTAGTSSFTIGPTGDLVVQRPVWIEGLNYVNPGSSSGNTTEVVMGPMDNDAYMALSIKDLASSLPTQFYYQTSQTGENGTLVIWPVPTQSVQLVLYLPQAVGQPALLTSVVTGPPGYAEAFMYQLAIRLCGPLGRPITEDLRDMAATAYSRIKRPNVEPGLMGVDAALVPTFGGAFNVLTGGWSGPSNR